MNSLWWKLRGAALLLAAVFSYAARHANNPGGIAYLDIADAYMRGDFANAVNGYWSPLYSLVLGPALVIVRPGPYYEASLAHLVNFLIFAGAMIAFEALLRAVMRRAEQEQQEQAIPPWAWMVFGYAAFTWSSLILINVSDLSADLLMAAFVYGAAALIVRSQEAPLSLAAGAGLGAMLALAYLSKAAMFPLSFLFLAVVLVSRGEWRRNIKPVAAALIAFTLVSAPFIVALSRQKGRPTFGEVGKLVYAWFVNDVATYAHWQGEPPGRGVPLHPDRRIHDRPTVYEYATPISGTHPIWYDPTYWYEGLQTHFDVRKQTYALMIAANTYWRLTIDASAPLLAIGALLAFGSREDLWRRLVRRWYLLVPGIVPFVMFAILHTETRFLGASVLMVFFGLLLAVRLPPPLRAARVAGILLAGAAIALAWNTVVPGARRLVARQGNVDYAIATSLTAMGVHPGDKIGMMGPAFDAYWARLAKVQIIAETALADVPLFWCQSAEERQSVYDAFRRAGARVIVSERLPMGMAAGADQGWRPLAEGRFAYWLDASETPSR